MISTGVRRPVRLTLRLLAVAAGLATVMVGAPAAIAFVPAGASYGGPPSDPGSPVKVPDGPKLLGQLKNGYNHLCMDSGGGKYSGKKFHAGTYIKFKKCVTVHHGHTSASQYFFLFGTGRGVQIRTLYNFCVAPNLHGNPVSGASLITKKCNGSDTTMLWQTVGGSSGVPYYWTAMKTNYHPSSLAIGYETKSAGADVALNPNRRSSAQAWHGKLAGP